ncbi:MAG: MFS transporter [Promethearchaeota archaeon]
MTSDQTFDIEANFNNSYPKIFSFFYLIEGIHQAIPAILPFYFIFVFGGYNISLILLITSIALLPWSMKVIVGLLNDKYGSKKYGQRFPFILLFGSFAGITWILMTFFLPLDESIYSVLVFYLFFANIGMAFADTSLDGLILDVTPKDKLAKVQGYTWTCLMLGSALAAFIGLLLYWSGIIQYLFIFIGIPMIISCILVSKIKEPPFNKGAHILEDLKRIVKEKKNWKVMGWTFITAMIYPIIAGAFFYFMLVTMGIIDVSQAANLSLGKGQTDDTFLIINIIIAGANGIGVVLGSMFLG